MNGRATPTGQKGRFKPYPAYKNSGVEWLGEIPAHWELLPIKRVASIRYGLGEPPRERIDGLPFIRATNVARGRIDDSDLKAVDPDDVPWSRNPTLHTDDIIVVRSGAYTGDSAIIPAKYDGAIAGYDMVVRARGVSPGFLAWALLSKYMLHAQVELERTRAAQPHLNAEELGGVVAILPPHSEQRAIVAYLDRETARIDALVAKEERLIELLQEKRTALITRAVTKGLNPNVPMKDSGVEWLGEVPADWQKTRLKFVIRRLDQGWSPLAENREATEDEWAVLKVGCVNGSQFNPTEHKALPADVIPPEELEIREGDVLVSRANTRELLGSTAIVERVRRRLLLCDKLYRLSLDTTQVEPGFFVLLLASRPSRHQLEIEAVGASNSMQNIAQGTIRNLLGAIPPRREQLEILAHLDRETRRIDALVAKIRDAIARLRELHTSLISAAVTGKIDVRGEVA